MRLDQNGEKFAWGGGVKQGNRLSPNLFKSVLEDQKLDWKGKGVKVNGQWLNNLRFADDVVLISSNMDEFSSHGGGALQGKSKSWANNKLVKNQNYV